MIIWFPHESGSFVKNRATPTALGLVTCFVFKLGSTGAISSLRQTGLSPILLADTPAVFTSFAFRGAVITAQPL
jgi:hypothetical protein